MAKSVKIGICILGFLLAGPVVFAQQSQSIKIERIDIRGNRRIPEDLERPRIPPFEDGALGTAYIRRFVTSWPIFTHGHGPTLMARPDFQDFLAKMNLDDASLKAVDTPER